MSLKCELCNIKTDILTISFYSHVYECVRNCIYNGDNFTLFLLLATFINYGEARRLTTGVMQNWSKRKVNMHILKIQRIS